MLTETDSDLRGQLETALDGDLPPTALITDPDSIVEAARIWNLQVDHRPAALVRCTSAHEIAAALRAARAAGLPVSVCGGGHDWTGRAIRDGGLVIDLRLMMDVEIEGSRSDAAAVIGGGATIADLVDAASSRGLATATGTVGSVGVAGLSTIAGYGTLNGALGLAVDNILSAEVVLADGRIIETDADHEPELFWALRGGGGNFGVISRLRMRLHPIHQVTAGRITFGWDEARAVLQGWRQTEPGADQRLDVMFALIPTPDRPIVMMTPVWSGPDEEADDQLVRVRMLGTPVVDEVARMSFADTVHAYDGQFGPGDYRIDTRLLPIPTDEGLDAMLAAAETMPAGCALMVHHAHGRTLEPTSDATAYPYREEHLLVEIIAHWESGGGSAATSWLEQTARQLDPFALPGGWPALMADDDPRAADAYGPNTERLLAAKRAYDPDGVFTATPLPR